MRLTTDDLISKDECLTEEGLKSYLSTHLSLNNPYYVYFLIDPTTFCIKYIGKGSKDRVFAHWVYDQNKNPKKQSWLNKLYKRNLKPLYCIWEFYNDEQQAYQQENNLIWIMGRKQLDKEGTLLNLQMDLGGGIKNRLKTTEQFIEEVEAIHGKGIWDFSKTKYVYAHDKVLVSCCKCKTEYDKHPSNLLNKSVHGCEKCKRALHGSKVRHNLVDLKDKVKELFKDIIEITSEIDYTDRPKVDINCKVCNTKASKRVDSLLNGSGCSQRCHLGLSPARASVLVGLSPHLLKQQLTPEIITEGGHCRYSHKQLELFKQTSYKLYIFL